MVDVDAGTSNDFRASELREERVIRGHHEARRYDLELCLGTSEAATGAEIKATLPSPPGIHVWVFMRSVTPGQGLHINPVSNDFLPKDSLWTAPVCQHKRSSKQEVPRSQRMSTLLEVRTASLQRLSLGLVLTSRTSPGGEDLSSTACLGFHCGPLRAQLLQHYAYPRGARSPH